MNVRSIWGIVIFRASSFHFDLFVVSRCRELLCRPSVQKPRCQEHPDIAAGGPCEHIYFQSHLA